jgi:hypothetical protein
MTYCKYCEAGHSPNDNGEHWMVKSIIPAHIDIAKCAVSTTRKATPMNQETAGRLLRLHEYLAEAMKDPLVNQLYIADLQETIAMLTPKGRKS